MLPGMMYYLLFLGLYVVPSSDCVIHTIIYWPTIQKKKKKRKKKRKKTHVTLVKCTRVCMDFKWKFASEVLCKVEPGHCTFLSDGSCFLHMGCFTIREPHLSHFWWKMKCFVIPQHAFFCVMNKPYIDYIKLLTYRHNLSWIQLK